MNKLILTSIILASCTPHEIKTELITPTIKSPEVLSKPSDVNIQPIPRNMSVPSAEKSDEPITFLSEEKIVITKDFYGQILNKENQLPVPYLSVQIDEASFLRTDENGRFKLNKIIFNQENMFQVDYSQDILVESNTETSINNPLKIILKCVDPYASHLTTPTHGYVFGPDGKRMEANVTMKSLHPCVKYEAKTTTETGLYAFNNVPVGIPIELEATRNEQLVASLKTYTKVSGICTNVFYLGKPDNPDNDMCYGNRNL